MTAPQAQLRKRIEDAIERLIELLDRMDGDPDREDNGDAEPWLGHGGYAKVVGGRAIDDIELDEAV